MNAICYIAASLPLPQWLPLSPSPEDLILAADGGHLHLSQRGITPHLVVGDFDSSSPPNHPHVIHLPVEKDDTDLGYALKLGRERGYTNFVLLGGLGGLLDHTMANLQHLHALSQAGCSALLVGDHQCATVVTNGSRQLPSHPNARCSVFALGGDAQEVTIEGLYYTLSQATLTPTFPLGVSNSFTHAPARISVAQGSLLLIWEHGETDPIFTFFT